MPELRLPPSPMAVPVLTEVLDFPLPEAAPPTLQPEAAAMEELPVQALGLAAGALPAAAAPHAPDEAPAEPLDEARLTAQVLADLRLRVDSMLEFRLRESLAPLLAQAADDMVQQARTELAATLRDVVARAVAQEIARQRNRG